MSYRGVALVLVSQDKQSILLQLRDNKPGISSPNCWSVPAGAVEEDEEPFAAIIREVKEETAYIVEKPELILKRTVVNLKTQLDEEWFVYGAVYDGKQSIECLEGQRMEFKPISEISRLKLSRTLAEIADDLPEIIGRLSSASQF